MEFWRILQTKKKELLQNWLEKVRKEIPNVNNYDKTAIQNSVPDLIDSIVEIMKTNNSHLIVSYSEQHGLERANFKSYTLKHIIQEYNLLKAEIFHVIDSSSEITAKNDRDIIMHAIDFAIEQSAETFYRQKQNVQLKARKIAEKKADNLKIKDENREEFIHSIMHDLNSPLNNIKACISMLEGDIEVGEARKLLEILKLSSQQAEIMIEDLLDVGDIESEEKLPLQKSLINVLEDIEQQVKIYKTSYKRDIKLNSNKEEIYINIDINLIRRAFNNLMNNALKHGYSSKTIFVNCELSNSYFQLSIRNEGLIPKNKLETIFNRYYKLNESTKGWGIGLSFVKKVAEAHGGSIFVESNENSGTIFRLKVPVV